MAAPVNIDVEALAQLGKEVTGMAPELENFAQRAADFAALLRRAVGNGGKGDEVTANLVAKFEKVDNIEGYLRAFASALRGTGDGAALAARMFAEVENVNTNSVGTFNKSVHV
jgi:hypothetical protein